MHFCNLSVKFQKAEKNPLEYVADIDKLINCAAKRTPGRISLNRQYFFKPGKQKEIEKIWLMVNNINMFRRQ
jgi:hypothetical protein